MTAYYGQPQGIISTTPPTALNIASSTNATPIVVTTSTSHSLQTGQLVIVHGHLLNTNANGVRLVTVLTTTTFSLQSVAGASIPTTGVIGGATGTVQSMAFPGMDLPQDAVTNIDAASVNVPFEALADMTAWLAYRVQAGISIVAGGILATNAEAQAFLASPVTLSGLVTVEEDVTFEPGATVDFQGLSRYRDPYRPTDANQLIGTSTGDVVLLAPTLAGVTRNIRLKTSTATVPLRGERLLLVAPNSEGGTPSHFNYSIQREDTTEIAQISGVGSWVLCQFEGGVWRGVKHSGVNLAVPEGGSVAVSAGW